MRLHTLTGPLALAAITTFAAPKEVQANQEVQAVQQSTQGRILGRLANSFSNERKIEQLEAHIGFLKKQLKEATNSSEQDKSTTAIIEDLRQIMESMQEDIGTLKMEQEIEKRLAAHGSNPSLESLNTTAEEIKELMEKAAGKSDIQRIINIVILALLVINVLTILLKRKSVTPDPKKPNSGTPEVKNEAKEGEIGNIQELLKGVAEVLKQLPLVMGKVESMEQVIKNLQEQQQKLVQSLQEGGQTAEKGNQLLEEMKTELTMVVRQLEQMQTEKALEPVMMNLNRGFFLGFEGLSFKMKDEPDAQVSTEPREEGLKGEETEEK